MRGVSSYMPTLPHLEDDRSFRMTQPLVSRDCDAIVQP